MTKINITIRGLSIIYLQNNEWQVVFICDNNHKLHLLSSIDNEPLVYQEDLAYPDRDRILNLTMAATNPSANTGADFDKIFKMTGQYAHKNGIKWERNFLDRGFFLANYTVVWLSIPNATVFTKRLTRLNYVVENKKPGGGPKRDIGKVAKEVGIEIQLTNSTVNLMEGNEEIASFGTDVTTHNIVLDNDCRARNCTNQDFFMYYRVLSDAIDSQQKFDAGQHISLKGKKMLGTAGNCDPIDGGGGGGPLTNF